MNNKIILKFTNNVAKLSISRYEAAHNLNVSNYCL